MSGWKNPKAVVTNLSLEVRKSLGISRAVREVETPWWPHVCDRAATNTKRIFWNLPRLVWLSWGCWGLAAPLQAYPCCRTALKGNCNPLAVGNCRKLQFSLQTETIDPDNGCSIANEQLFYSSKIGGESSSTWRAPNPGQEINQYVANWSHCIKQQISTASSVFLPASVAPVLLLHYSLDWKRWGHRRRGNMEGRRVLKLQYWRMWRAKAGTSLDKGRQTLACQLRCQEVLGHPRLTWWLTSIQLEGPQFLSTCSNTSLFASLQWLLSIA